MLTVLMTTLVQRLTEWSFSHWAQIVLLGILTAVAIEQLSYMNKGKNIPGPSWTVPFIGGIVTMVKGPFAFWHDQMALGPISWNAIIGQYFVMVTDAVAIRKIFKSVSARQPLVLHPNANILLGDKNIAFLNGEEHRDLKHSLLPLFTQTALSTYLTTQESHIREVLTSWIAESKLSGDALVMRQRIFDLNTNTSMSVFVGPYLTAETRKELQVDYAALTEGILAFPLYVPGTKLWKGKQAVNRIMRNLTAIATASKQRMSSSDAKPECLLDYWMQNLIPRINEAQLNKSGSPPHSTDSEIAHVMLDFLFASQDASTSSLTFTIHLLCQHPEILAKVRAEQALVRPDRSAPVTPEVLAKMTYTRQVMREILRFRPPATIVPHLTHDEIELNGYKTPANTLLIPSVWSSNRVGFTNPETFDPDRYNEQRDEERKFGENFMTFGLGPHVCLGQRYAMNHIMLFIALLSTECEFVRKLTPNMHEIIYLPTIYPADDCPLQTIRARN